MKQFCILLLLVVFCTESISAQNIGIGTNAPHSSAQLDISNNNRGLLIPRVALTGAADVTTILAPAISLLVYNTATAGAPPDVFPGYYYWNGIKWVSLSGGTGGNDWGLSGNAGTNANNNFIGTTDNQNLFFKRNNIRSGWIDTTNTSFGVAALSSVSSAKYNTGFGGYALYSNSFGDANSAFGYGALSANAGGIRNTGAGVNALALNTSGSDNTAVGTSSLYSNTSGTVNTATGVQSLFSNTTGSGNTANGYNSLYTNTTGNSNTATGFYSLVSNTTGHDNTAMGIDALTANVSGNNNVAVGGLSLGSNTSGSFNTAVGYSAGQNQTGIRNTAIGYQAGFGSNNLGNATAIGANAVVDTSNALVLGNNANVGIGISKPLKKLHVVGNSRFEGVIETDYFQMHTDEGVGKVLVSDNFGNGHWKNNILFEVEGFTGTFNIPPFSSRDIDLWSNLSFNEGGGFFNFITGEYWVPETGIYKISVKLQWSMVNPPASQELTLTYFIGGFSSGYVHKMANNGYNYFSETFVQRILFVNDKIKVRITNNTNTTAQFTDTDGRAQDLTIERISYY